MAMSSKFRLAVLSLVNHSLVDSFTKNFRKDDPRPKYQGPRNILQQLWSFTERLPKLMQKMGLLLKQLYGSWILKIRNLQ